MLEQNVKNWTSITTSMQSDESLLTLSKIRSAVVSSVWYLAAYLGHLEKTECYFMHSSMDTT